VCGSASPETANTAPEFSRYFDVHSDSTFGPCPSSFILFAERSNQGVTYSPIGYPFPSTIEIGGGQTVRPHLRWNPGHPVALQRRSTARVPRRPPGTGSGPSDPLGERAGLNVQSKDAIFGATALRTAGYGVGMMAVAWLE